MGVFGQRVYKFKFIWRYINFWLLAEGVLYFLISAKSFLKHILKMKTINNVFKLYNDIEREGFSVEKTICHTSPYKKLEGKHFTSFIEERAKDY